MSPDDHDLTKITEEIESLDVDDILKFIETTQELETENIHRMQLISDFALNKSKC